jgi:hypothetical protein
MKKQKVKYVFNQQTTIIILLLILVLQGFEVL